jgi:hypothetical protein
MKIHTGRMIIAMACIAMLFLVLTGGAAYAANPDVQWTATPVNGTAPLEVDFHFTTGGAWSAFDLDFGDGSSHFTDYQHMSGLDQCHVIHTYTDAGVYDVTASLTSGGTDYGPTTKSEEITVIEGPYSDTTNALSVTFVMLGGMMDGFATLVPHIINLIVAFIPLAILGAVVGAVLLLVYEVPKYTKIGKGKAK